VIFDTPEMPSVEIALAEDAIEEEPDFATSCYRVDLE